ncbi:MAG: hypothetical protein ACREA0_05620 [bacterium]
MSDAVRVLVWPGFKPVMYLYRGLDQQEHPTKNEDEVGLLNRVFEIDIEQCPRCGGTLKIIAASNIPPSSPKSSRISACPPGHRPDPRAAIRSTPNTLIRIRYAPPSDSSLRADNPLGLPPKMPKHPKT